MNGIEQPFWVIVNKEIRDHVRSWRFIILLAIITLTCLGALYTSLTSMHEAVKSGDVEDTFFFLKLFTVQIVHFCRISFQIIQFPFVFHIEVH